MRLWSVHPSALDRAALISCWREALLAQKVLAGRTKGYTQHPQLERFRAVDDPLDAVGHFLQSLRTEATARGYQFDGTRIYRPEGANPAIALTTGQLEYELGWLRTKVTGRAPEWLPRLDGAGGAPSFTLIEGPIASWERV